MSVDFSLVPGSAIASAVFIEQEYKRSGVGGLLLPQKVALIGQFNVGKTPTANQPLAITSADEAANYFGLGSMLHLMAKALFAGLGTSGVEVDAFPVGDGTGTAAGAIAVSGTSTTAGTISLYIAGKLVTVAVASGTVKADIATAIANAINADLDLPVTATALDDDVTITCRWVGLSGNQINIAQDLGSGDASGEPASVTLTITPMASGSADPSIETALANLNTTFYTWVVCPYNADASCDLLEASGAARIDPGVKKPFIGVVGSVAARADYLTWLSSRNSPWTTSFCVEGSPNHPAEIAAAVVGVCSKSADADPSRPFKTLLLPGIMPGAGADWTWAQKDAVETAGGSTYFTSNGSVGIYDLLTTYVTNALGAVDESWRYTETIANIQAKIYSLDQLFSGTPFDRAVVVDDDAVTSKQYAISPKRVKAYVINLVDNLWIPEGWSKERDSIVAGILAEIDSTNPGRINVLIPDVITTGLRIMAIKYQWSFAAAS